MMRKVLLVVSALLILASVASAAPITTLTNTGLGAPGSVDSSWTVNGQVAYVTSGWPLGAWKVNDATSAWISPQSTYDGFLSDAGGGFAFSTSFEIPDGYATSSAWFAMRLMVDNHLAGVTLNGVALPISYFSGALSHTAFNTWSDVYTGSPFLVTSGFVSGVNTLTFLVENHPQTDPGNPTGLRVEFLESDMEEVEPVPEPASILLLGTGILGAVRAARKRN